MKKRELLSMWRAATPWNELELSAWQSAVFFLSGSSILYLLTYFLKTSEFSVLSPCLLPLDFSKDRALHTLFWDFTCCCSHDDLTSQARNCLQVKVMYFIRPCDAVTKISQLLSTEKATELTDIQALESEVWYSDPIFIVLCVYS